MNEMVMDIPFTKLNKNSEEWTSIPFKLMPELQNKYQFTHGHTEFSSQLAF